MKRTAVMTAVAFLVGLAFTGFALAAGEYGKSEQQKSPSGVQSTQPGMSGQSQVGAAAQQQIRAAADIQKFNVQTAAGEKLGKVDKVVVDMEQGRIGYVTVSAAQGTDKYIIPWKALRADPQQQTLVVSMSADQIRQAPKGDIQQIMDRQKGREIHQFFGVSPYWEETGMQPRSMQPGMQQPGMQQPGQSQPGMQQPGQSQPGMRQPGQTQPGQTQPGQSTRPGSSM